MMSRGLSDVAVVVVANKMDLLSHPDTEERGKLRQDISNKVGQTCHSLHHSHLLLSGEKVLEIEPHGGERQVQLEHHGAVQGAEQPAGVCAEQTGGSSTQRGLSHLLPGLLVSPHLTVTFPQ